MIALPLILPSLTGSTDTTKSPATPVGVVGGVLGSVSNTLKSILSTFNFGGKLVYGLQKTEFELAFSGNGKENLKWLRVLCVNPISIWKDHPELLEGMSLGDYWFSRAGYRSLGAEGYKSPHPAYWVMFNPYNLGQNVGYDNLSKDIDLSKEFKTAGGTHITLIKDYWSGYNINNYDVNGKILNYASASIIPSFGKLSKTWIMVIVGIGFISLMLWSGKKNAN
jgi:hypothetical protein